MDHMQNLPVLLEAMNSLTNFRVASKRSSLRKSLVAVVAFAWFSSRKTFPRSSSRERGFVARQEICKSFCTGTPLGRAGAGTAGFLLPKTESAMVLLSVFFSSIGLRPCLAMIFA